MSNRSKSEEIYGTISSGNSAENKQNDSEYICIVCKRTLSSRQRLHSHYVSENSKCVEGFILDTKNWSIKDRKKFQKKYEKIVGTSSDFLPKRKKTLTSSMRNSTEHTQSIEPKKVSNGSEICDENKKIMVNCPNCSKQFSRQDNMNRHIRLYCKTKITSNSNNVMGVTEGIVGKNNSHNNIKSNNITHENCGVVVHGNNNTVSPVINNNMSIINIGNVDFSLEPDQVLKFIRMRAPYGDMAYIQKVMTEQYYDRGLFPLGCTDPRRNKFYYVENDRVKHTSGDVLTTQLCRAIKKEFVKANNHFGKSIREKYNAEGQYDGSYVDYLNQTVRIADLHLQQKKICKGLREILNIKNYDNPSENFPPHNPSLYRNV